MHIAWWLLYYGELKRMCTAVMVVRRVNKHLCHLMHCTQRVWLMQCHCKRIVSCSLWTTTKVVTVAKKSEGLMNYSRENAGISCSNYCCILLYCGEKEVLVYEVSHSAMLVYKIGVWRRCEFQSTHLPLTGRHFLHHTWYSNRGYVPPAPCMQIAQRWIQDKA